MFTKIIKIDEKVRDEQERLGLEVDGSAYVIAYMLDHNNDMTTESFKKFKHELDKNFAAYNIGKQTIQDLYVPKALIEADGNFVSWNLEFSSCELVVTYTGTKLTEAEFEGFFA